MKATLEKWIGDISSSYWFVPTIMVLGSIILAVSLIEVDSRYFKNLPKWLIKVVASEPDGARAVLNAIAGSMITVAGVTFSVTISAVAYATSQFGPRLLVNFMGDRGNQITLGTFISTFVYSILVLRTVRVSNEDLSVDKIAGLGEVFVPHIAIAGGILMAMASVVVLIYFIHHVPASIHVARVVASIATELNQQVDRLCDARQSDRDTETVVDHQQKVLEKRDFTEADLQSWAVIVAKQSGYLQNMSTGTLLSIATENDLRLYVDCRPGHFVIEGKPIVWVSPGLDSDGELPDRISGCFAWGQHRTYAEDMTFLVQELVDIATRALSPGINDPVTAITCMHWLGAALSNMARRFPPAYQRFDEAGRVRVQYPKIGFETALTAVCDTLRAYVVGNPIAATALMRLLVIVKAEAIDTGDVAAIERQASALVQACEISWQDERDVKALNEIYTAFANETK